MEFRILGPLEVFDRDGPVGLGGDKQRALLAILLLHANEVVSTDRLIEDLWGERPPATSLRTLQAYVSRLRKALDTNGGGSLDDNGDPSSGGSGGVLVTRGHGYLLRVAPGELDLDRFRGLVEGGRRALAAGETATAARILREGLAMWRGPPLADFTYEAFAQAAIAQLEELHLGAVEERAEADLALGRHRDLVGELTALVERNPLRERLRSQLMLAGARSRRSRSTRRSGEVCLSSWGLTRARGCSSSSSRSSTAIPHWRCRQATERRCKRQRARPIRGRRLSIVAG
jgi:DNA-binding SARP family transcriptional activator